MLRNALTLASLTLVVSGCGGIGKTAPKTAASASVKTAKSSAHKAAAKPKAGDDVDGSKVATRKVGDFHVYEYSGSFSKEPVRLTEQVVAQKGDVTTVDFVLDDGKTKSALRVRMKPEDEIIDVARVTKTGQEPATLADYDALMKRVEFVPDSNDEALGTEHTSCLVGEEQVDCDVSTYKVTLGHAHGKLSVTTSPKFPGRDIGGNVVTDDGKILYSAKLVERGNDAPLAEAFAKADLFVPTEP